MASSARFRSERAAKAVVSTSTMVVEEHIPLPMGISESRVTSAPLTANPAFFSTLTMDLK